MKPQDEKFDDIMRRHGVVLAEVEDPDQDEDEEQETRPAEAQTTGEPFALTMRENSGRIVAKQPAPKPLSAEAYDEKYAEVLARHGIS